MATYLEIIRGLNKIPGIGKKSAERMTFYFLEGDADEIKDLLDKIKSFINLTQRCRVCGLISKNNPCNICSSLKRNKNIICLVKSVQDALMIERSKSFLGLYHVIGKLISPLNDVYKISEVELEKLTKRINKNTREVIFALENTQAGRMTIEYLMEKLKTINPAIKFTSIAVGVPIGTSLEYIDKETLKSSIDHRFSIQS